MVHFLCLGGPTSNAAKGYYGEQMILNRPPGYTWSVSYRSLQSEWRDRERRGVRSAATHAALDT